VAIRNKKIWRAVLVVFAALMLGSLSSGAWSSAQQQPTPAAPAIQKDGLKLMLNFEDIDLHEFINQIAFPLGLTPITIDPDVKGKVTVRMPSPMPKEDVLPLFHKILKNNKAALIKQGDVYQIVPIADPIKQGADAK
jgi:type II secretory pathway component GspD/PulD (secretin)